MGKTIQLAPAPADEAINDNTLMAAVAFARDLTLLVGNAKAEGLFQMLSELLLTSPEKVLKLSDEATLAELKAFAEKMQHKGSFSLFDAGPLMGIVGKIIG